MAAARNPSPPRPPVIACSPPESASLRANRAAHFRSRAARSAACRHAASVSTEGPTNALPTNMPPERD
eukprot:3118578-Prymnesium_polylepis.1